MGDGYNKLWDGYAAQYGELVDSCHYRYPVADGKVESYPVGGSITQMHAFFRTG